MSGSVIRQTAERVLGPLVFNRRLPQSAGGGLIRVSTRLGGLKFLFRSPDQWDPELLSIAKTLVSPGDHIWDVGANVGLFATAAAFHSGVKGSVLAIEADLDVIALLQETVRRSASDRAQITVLPVAISDAQAVLSFAIARRARAANSIAGFGSTQTGGVSEVRTLPSTTLDSLLEHFPRPDLLKIDVEGAELLVLSGARKVLEQVQPKIYCEVAANTRDAACDTLAALGYTLYDGEGYGQGARKPVSDTTCNIVAIPSSAEANRKAG